MLVSGTCIGEYQLGRCLAIGATSEVYEAYHATQGMRVAVKVLNPEWCLHAEVVARFLNEARTLQNLRHPHLIQALACGSLPEGRPFMVLEWRPEDLHRALARAGGQLPEGECTQIVRQLAQALAVLHAENVVHRDLKPANVLVVRREPGAWHVQLADLGLAKRLVGGSERNSSLQVSTAGDALLGSREYMAPEQWLRSKAVEVRADVYSLGVIWFQLLAGRLPFTGAEPEGLRFSHVVRPPPMELLVGRAAPDSLALLARMLAKTAPERPFVTGVLEQLPP